MIIVVPEVSIIIPIYNKCRYLNNLWINLRNQSFHDFECIIIDDGSTDGSSDSCDQVAGIDSRFKVIHINNSGVSHARNIALNYVCGKYVTFIDADDSFDINYLQNLYECIVTYNVDMVISSSVKIWNNSEKIVPISVPFQGVKNVDEIMPEFVKHQMSTGIYGFCWGKIVKGDVIGGNRFNENIKLAEDLDFYLGIYPKIKTIYFDDHYYYFYLQAAENSSMLKNDWEIDYYTQLLIQLKLYNTVQKMGFLYGENRILSESRIWDYVFFSIYYAPINKVGIICDKIRLLHFEGKCKLLKRPLRQIGILVLYLLKFDDLLILLLKIFRKIKRTSY